MSVNNTHIRKGKEEDEKERHIELLTRKLYKKLPQQNPEKIRMILKDSEDEALKNLSDHIFDIEKLSEVVKIIEE